MNKYKLLAIALLIGTLSLFANDKRPNVSKDEIVKQIIELVQVAQPTFANNTTIRTNKAAKAYFDKNGVSLIDTTEYSASIFALDYLKVLSNQIIKNQSVTGSTDSPLLFQSGVTQSVLSGFTNGTQSGISASIYVVNSLVDVIKKTIEAPILVEQSAVRLVTNVTIPPADSLSPVVSGKLVLEETYGFIVSGSTELTVVLSLLESANE